MYFAKRFQGKFFSDECNVDIMGSRREQYYWVRYWYWVILGCFRTIGISIGIVKGFTKYWYWYLVLFRAFQSIGIGIGYC